MGSEGVTGAMPRATRAAGRGSSWGRRRRAGGQCPYGALFTQHGVASTCPCFVITELVRQRYAVVAPRFIASEARVAAGPRRGSATSVCRREGQPQRPR